MGILGTNVPSDGIIPAAEIADIYPNGVVRIVLQKKFYIREYLKTLKSFGLSVFACIARESLDGFSSVEEAADYYLTEYGTLIDYLQVGNEWDHISGSSWTMAPDDLYDLVYSFWKHPRLNGIPLILGGAVSGDPNALDRIYRTLPLLDGISIHPYGQRYSEGHVAPSGDFGVAETLFHTYQQKLASLGFDMKMYVSEYGVSSDQVGLDNQVEYISGFAMMLRRSTAIVLGIHFCQHNYQGFGVRDGREGIKRKLADNLRAAAINQQGDIKVAQYQFTLGILAKANELRAKGVDVGEPKEPETYPYPGSPYSYQFTTTGKFEYSTRANLAHFFKGE